MHTAWQHRSPDEMKRLQQLAQAAVGYDDKRGDQVVLENVAFSSNVDPAVPGNLARFTDGAQDLLRAQPTLPRAIATGLGILVLGMMVLRPLTKQTQQLLTAPVKPQLITAGKQAAQAPEPAAALASGATPMTTQQVFDRVSQQIKSDPRASTRLVGSWIGANEEEG